WQQQSLAARGSLLPKDSTRPDLTRDGPLGKPGSLSPSDPTRHSGLPPRRRRPDGKNGRPDLLPHPIPSMDPFPSPPPLAQSQTFPLPRP
ncbi:hypothetical protein Pmani_036657, partial [Petrolisthes manimaculis]